GERQRRGRRQRHRFVTPPRLNRCPGMLTWDTPKGSDDAPADSWIAPERDLSRPARDSAQATPRTSWAAAAASHAGVALCVAGAPAVRALTVFVVPAPVFLAVFTVITAVLVIRGVRAVATGRLLAGRGWLAWAGLSWGLVVTSGAYVFRLSGLVPHLWL